MKGHANINEENLGDLAYESFLERMPELEKAYEYLGKTEEVEEMMKIDKKLDSFRGKRERPSEFKKLDFTCNLDNLRNKIKEEKEKKKEDKNEEEEIDRHGEYLLFRLRRAKGTITIREPHHPLERPF